MPASHPKRPGWWATPLFEMEKRPRLVWGVHLVYFGLVIAGSVLIYHFPDIQTVLLAQVRDALTAPSGPLASAARAYAHRQHHPRRRRHVHGQLFPRIASHADTAFDHRARQRRFHGGPALARVGLAAGADAHGAGVRNAAAFRYHAPGGRRLHPRSSVRALIPIHIFQSSLGGTPLSRFGRVILLNIQANLWVAIVLAVAACYEATEVILMNR